MRIEEKLYQRFTLAKKTLALAESCTGGRIAASLTSVPGASEYFLGSLVTYSNSMKQKILGVKEKTLLDQGAVSSETAREMLLGVFLSTDADVAAAVTGIAGPTGGTPEKPVGTVWVAMGFRGKAPVVEKLQFSGNRQEIVESTVNHILNSLLSLSFSIT